MSKTVINFRVDEKVKQQAQQLANELGVSLSAVINSQLKHLIRTKTLEITTKPATKSTSSEKNNPVLIKQDDRLRFGYIQYTPELASYWDNFIDWNKRKEGEKGFFINILKAHKVRTVLDFACGTGYDSIQLLDAGLGVKSSDGSLFMLTKARINAEDRGLKIDARFCDWRRLQRNFTKKFDAAVCLGNSFCHLFDAGDRVEVLKQVANLLPKDGVFIIDQRNFDKVLDKGFSSKHKYVYCGTDADVNVAEKSDDYLRLVYDVGKLKFEFEIYPIRYTELRELLKETGFDVISYGDFKTKFDKYEPDFFQHMCIKK